MNLAQQLEREEKRMPSAYKDHLGFLTIGVGRLIDGRKGGGLSDDEIDYLLANDIKAKTADVLDALPWVARLNEPRQAAIIGMAFQMGIGNAQFGTGLLGFRQALAAIRDEHYAHAEGLLLDSAWARQTPERAKRMAKQISTGEWQ